MIFALGATSQSVDIQIVDDSGLPVEGLDASTFPALSYSLAGAHASVAFGALSDLALITTAFSANGVKERSGGRYRLDVPDAMFTTAGHVQIMGEETDKRVIVPVFEVGTVEGDTVIVNSTTSTVQDRLQSTTITVFFQETGWTIGPNPILDADGDPIDISTFASLRLTIEDEFNTDLLVTTSVTVSGTGNNEWSATGTLAVTSEAPRCHQWSLRGISPGINIVLGRGDVNVIYAADEDPEEEP